MSQRVDKDSLQLDKPRRTPGHPTKSHIVKTKVDGKEKIIRFGEQGASTAGKPKAGESERMTKKRASFKARHAKNIAKGKSSPAYWADKVKWNTGGSVELKNMLDDYEKADDVTQLVQKFKNGGQPKKTKKDVEPGIMDYLESAYNTASSLPNLPNAIYQSGKRAVQAIPANVRSGLNYIQRSTPQKVLRDARQAAQQTASSVKGGLNRVVEHVKENPLETIVDVIPVVGDIKAYGEDVGRAARLRAQGDERGAANIEQYALPLAVASVIPGIGEARTANRIVNAADEVVDAARLENRKKSLSKFYNVPEDQVVEMSKDPGKALKVMADNFELENPEAFNKILSGDYDALNEINPNDYKKLSVVIPHREGNISGFLDGFKQYHNQVMEKEAIKSLFSPETSRQVLSDYVNSIGDNRVGPELVLEDYINPTLTSENIAREFGFTDPKTVDRLRSTDLYSISPDDYKVLYERYPAAGKQQSVHKAAVEFPRYYDERVNQDALNNFMDSLDAKYAPSTQTMKQAASFPVDYGRPKGNLNLRPSIDPVTIKGTGVQDVDSLINQLRGKPGVTKQGLERVAAQFEPGERVTAAQFGERLPRSEYSTVDLASAVNDPFEHLVDDAHDMVNQDRGELFARIAEEIGMGYDEGRTIQDLYDNGFRRDEPGHNLAFDLISRRFPNEDPERMLDGLYRETHSDAVDMTVEQLQDMAADGAYGDPGGYSYRDYQRLVPEEMHQGQGYFEVGVTHPEMTDKYRHYPNAENLAGHIRGTFNPKNLLSGAAHYGSNFSSPATVEELLGGSAQRAYTFRPKPNSMVIEELQSDAAKNLGDTGALHQIHGTLFKSALQHALEGGAETVYLPTAKAIGISRFTNPDDYRSIYDKEVVKYGLNPLRDMPGVEINPIDDMYHEITVSPEARERILKGVGQKAPGYAQGGLVSTYDEAIVKDLADKIREGIYG